MNQAEIDELRRLHENNERSCQALGGPAHCRGDKKLHTRCQCADMAWDALPRLLAALEEAMAERDRMRDVLLRNNFAPCDTQACNCGGWHERATGDGFYARFREIEEAIGDHNGKTVLAAVVEMVQERDSLEEARAERSEARSLLLNGIQTNGDSLAFLEHVRREHAAVVAERDALPRLLAALEEARAERDDAVALIDAAKSDTRPESFLEHAQAILAKCVAPYSCEQMKAVGDAMAQWYRKWELSSEVAMKACEDRDAAESIAWDALGRPDGTHDTSNVQRLCEAHGALKAKLAHAEAEAAGYQKLAQACKDEDGKTVVVIIQGESEVRVFGPNSDCEERFGEVVVRWWKLLDTVVESKAFDALKAERDALKATLAKRAESERAWCELATARGAELAALVAEVDDIVTNGIDDAEGAGGYSSEFALGCLCRALAAAKVQP